MMNRMKISAIAVGAAMAFAGPALALDDESKPKTEAEIMVNDPSANDGEAVKDQNPDLPKDARESGVVQTGEATDPNNTNAEGVSESVAETQDSNNPNPVDNTQTQ